MKTTVIVGGVAGGASCAARLRRLDEDRKIILLERGEYISYANCGLPYHVGNVIRSRDALLVSKPELLELRFRIDVRTKNEAIKIDRKNKKVTVLDQNTGNTYEEEYDELVLATGSSPLRPRIPGIESDLIRTLWTVPDADVIRKAARESGIRDAAVIGGGFIGLEIAENLRADGLDVSIVEGADQVMPPSDREMAKVIEEHIEENGVHLYLGSPVEKFEEITENGSRKIRISAKGGLQITAGLVILSIGTRPNTSLAKEAGLMLNERGAVVTDEYMRTSDPSIYAAGDIAEITDFVTGSKAQYQLAGPANKQGRIVADNIAGRKETYSGTMAASIAKVFDMAIGMTGQSEKALVRRGMVKGRDFDTVYITQNHHVGYYPGASPLTIKILYTPDGKRILGAQIVGREGVDKRIDTISVAMRLGAEVSDLTRLELAYAPPFSSAKDPVNMAGFMIQNRLEGLVDFCEWDDPDKEKELQLLDVREDAERLAFEIPGAINIPLGKLRDELGKLDRNKRTIVFCAIGVRAYNGARILMQHGFNNVQIYPGGARFYQSTHYDTIRTAEGGNDPVRKTNREEEGASSAGKKSCCDPDIRVRLDCSGMQCPGPLMKIYQSIEDLAPGSVLEVTASDPGFSKDITAWCRRTGNILLSNEKKNGEYVACVKKKESRDSLPVRTAGTENSAVPGGDGKTIIVFSGDMDRVLASFIIANGAASMGKPVTMFFTFWGLSVLRKPEKQNVRKTFTEKMFGSMLPRGTSRLRLSKMNMGGIGTAMMKKIMKDKNVDSLEDLIKKAVSAGVKIVACAMSMDVMGIKPEELIDGVEIGGVGYYLGDAEESDINLFI